MFKPQKYIKKPVEIEAFLLHDPDSLSSIDAETHNSALAEFMGDCDWSSDGEGIAIETDSGTMVAKPTDYIIKGIKGEYYPCKADIFEATYETQLEKSIRILSKDNYDETLVFAKKLRD